jgi:agmatine deiminase
MINYTMPAEWAPHKAIWLAWPHDEITFPNRIPKVEDDVAKIISAIHTSELVELLVLDSEMETRAKEKLTAFGVDLAKVNFRQLNYMDGWMRDVGPIFVKDISSGGPVLVKWIFNQWGGKFPDLLPDDAIPYKVKEWLGLKMEQPELVLEGGAIDVNGQGLCLTTEQCLLNENRNLGKTKKDIEQYLEQYLGIKKTIWLYQGLVNDHTDGHIDELARFVSENKIVCGYEENPDSENYTILKNNYETLVSATNLEGQPLEIVKLPMPHLYYKEERAGGHIGDRVPASYTNFYIGNTVVLAAIFNDPNDQQALDILQSCFPDKKVVGIDCTDLIYGGGAVHCMTQQQPL